MKGRLTQTTWPRKAAARPASLLLVAVSLFCLGVTEARAAAPLSDYRARVRKAAELAGTPVLTPDSGESAVAAHYTKTAAELRRLLPATEQVESGGVTMTVNNAWLHTLLDDNEKSAARLTALERAASFARIADRLAALDARLAESEAAAQQSPPARDKDAEKGRLASILRGKEYNRETAEGGALQRLFERIADALGNLFPGMRPVRRGGGRGSAFVLYAILAVALGVVIYFLRRYWIGRRLEFGDAAPRAARVVLGERIEADQNASDLLTEAEMLAREGDLRGAIRKAYVALLCELGDRKIVSLARHKTNRDYLRDARRDAPPRLYEEMRPLTEGFERHWYGLEQADQTDWANYRTRCRQALDFK